MPDIPVPRRDTVELCRACDDPIEYEHIYYSEVFVTPDDRAFHIDCWTAWVLDGNEL